MLYLSVDIGYNNLALIKSDENKKVSDCDLVDIKKTKDNCHDPECKLYHDNCFTDYMEHVFKEYSDYFDTDAIILERQPPEGFVVIEQLIHSKFRSKSIIISPSSMHAHFDIGHYDYETRKKCTEKIAEKYLENFPTYKFAERKHDMADAMCQLIYYLAVLEEKRVQKEIDDRIKEDNRIFLENGGQNFINNMSKYIFK